MNTQTFHTTLTQRGNKVVAMLPFNPNEVWGNKARHHIHGTINNCPVRGEVAAEGEAYYLAVGEAWRRDNNVAADSEVEIVLHPEGPQSAALSPDIAAALADEAGAAAFFDALPTFYRKNYIRWIESAKRPETRGARIREMVELLKAGKRER